MNFNPTMTTLLASDVEEKLDRIKKETEIKIRNGEFATKEDLKSYFKKTMAANAIDDEKLKFVGLAFSFDEGSAYLESGLDAYCTHLADINFKKQEKKEDEKPKAPYFIQFDKEVLKSLKTKEAIKNYASQCIGQAIADSGNKEGDPEKLLNNLVSNYQNVNVEYGIQLSSDSTLKDALTDCLVVSQKELLSQELKESEQKPQRRSDILSVDLQNLIDENDRKNPEMKPLVNELDRKVEQKPHIEEAKENRIKQDQKNNDELTIDISEIGEGSSNINYFVGYDKDGVNKLFDNKPKEFIDAFESFVNRFNELMNKLLNQDLNEQTVDQIQNDIDPEFLKFAALCNNYGAEGVQIQNLCRGMISILNSTCDAEKEGKNIDGLKLKSNLETTQALDFTDRDGLRREDGPAENNRESNKPVLTQSIERSFGVKSLIAEDALTPEDQQEIAMFGITDILTHSAMEMFRKTAEYELLQSMNVFGLSKDDTPPM